MDVMKFVIGVLVVLIGWDVVTTYYGTISLFAGSSPDVFTKLTSVPGVIHVIGIIFAVALITFVLSYKHILRANNTITKGTLFIAFIYDFGTSIYGTASAAGVNSNTTAGDNIIAQWAIILLLAIMATGAPLLIHQVMEGTE